MRPLIPREHGAYGQLCLPLLAALAMGRPTLGSGCLMVAALAGFFAHESVLVLLGRRGARVKHQQRNRAIGSGLGWILLTVASGLCGLWLGGESVLRAIMIPLVLALLMTPVVLSGREKTLGGEIAAATTLAAACIPVAVTVGLAYDHVLFVWGSWVIAFTVSTAAVRCVIATQKGLPAGKEVVTAFVVTLVAAALTKYSVILLSTFPYLLVSWILIGRPPSARHLRRVGWTLVATGVLTASAAIALVRMV